MAKDRDDAVTAGRGFLLIAGAKAYFIVASALLALGLPRFLGPHLFGEFKVVSSFISILNMVLIVGTIQTVSRLVSEDEGCARALRRRALTIQLVVGGGIALLVLALAPIIAGGLFNDPTLTLYLRVGVGVTFLYALYAVWVGLLNGLKRFAAQASLDILFSTLKIGLIVGLVLLGFGVLGAFVGFVTASAITVAASAIVVSRVLPPSTSPAPSVRKIAALLTPLLLSTLMINLMLQIDVLAIKGAMHPLIADYLGSGEGKERLDGLLATLGTTGSPELTAAFTKSGTDRLAGLYGAAKNVSLLPYQATFALTFVVFPLMSRAAFSDDRDRAKGYVRQALRFTLVLGGALAVVLASTARPILSILLGPGYASASTALVILLVSTVALALLVLCITILNAAGAERAALGASAATVACGFVLLIGLLRTTPDLGSAPLLRAAIATAGSIATGFLVVGWLVYRRIGAFAPAATALRVVGIGGALIGLATLWPVTGFLGLVAKAATIGVLFLLGLAITGELTAADRSAIGRIVGRGAPRE